MGVGLLFGILKKTLSKLVEKDSKQLPVTKT